jgi:hypothetical protein
VEASPHPIEIWAAEIVQITGSWRPVVQIETGVMPSRFRQAFDLPKFSTAPDWPDLCTSSLHSPIAARGTHDPNARQKNRRRAFGARWRATP